MDYKEEIKNEKYEKAYSEKNLFTKILKFAKKAGIKVMYLVLLLYFTLQKPDTPKWAKKVIIGALGYFILPLDLIPDFIPLAGFTDDYAALSVALMTVAFYVDPDIKAKASEKLHDWFGDYDHTELKEVYEKMETQQ